MIRGKLLGAIVLVLMWVSTASAGVLVVNNLGGGDFLFIQDAVDAAVDGDIILVKDGGYAGFTIDDKSLVVVEDLGDAVQVLGPVTVKNLAPSRTVTLSRLRLVGVTTPVPGAAAGHGVQLLDNDGHVTLQACEVIGSDGYQVDPGSFDNTDSWSAVNVERSGSVSIVLSILKGGDTPDANDIDPWEPNFCNLGRDGGHGLRAVDSDVTLYDSLVEGGIGAHAICVGGDGGHGAFLTQSTLYASNTNFKGGDGGDADDFIPPSEGDGGDGVRVGPGSLARILDGQFTVGAPGFAFVFGTFGAEGQAIGGTGTHVPLSGDARGFNLPRVLLEGQSSFMVFTGGPGDQAFLFLGLSPAATWLPAQKSVLLLDPTTLLGPVPIGPIPASGSLSVPFIVPSLPPGVDGIAIALQGVVSDGTGQAIFGGMARIIILDAP